MTMSDEHKTPTIQISHELGCSAEQAFELFAHQMHDWSPASQSLLGTRAAIHIEPNVGGRWFEVSADGQEADWGKVLEWSPPNRLILAWQLDANFGYDPSLVTEVEAAFSPTAHGSKLGFEHRNLDRYGERAGEVFQGLSAPDGWPGALDNYSKLTGKGAR